MPFNADLTGATWGPVEWTATPRRILAFRAVVAPDDADGLDDAAGQLTMSPMQVVTPEWVLALASRADPRQTLSEAEGRRGVHAAQDSRFLRPVVAGETLSCTAELLGVRASRSGAVSVTRYQSRVGDELVAESLSTSVLRDVAVEGADRPLPPEESPPPLAAPTSTTPVDLPRGFPHLYSECADIWNPIHTERAVALAAGLPDILVHGTALWAIGGLSAAPAGARITRLAARFRSPAWAGEPMLLETGAEADARTPWRLTATDGRVLTEGFVEVAA